MTFPENTNRFNSISTTRLLEEVDDDDMAMPCSSYSSPAQRRSPRHVQDHHQYQSEQHFSTSQTSLQTLQASLNLSQSSLHLPLPCQQRSAHEQPPALRRQNTTLLLSSKQSLSPSMRFALTFVCVVCMGLSFVLQSQLVTVVVVGHHENVDDAPTGVSSSYLSLQPPQAQRTLNKNLGKKTQQLQGAETSKIIDISNTAETDKNIKFSLRPSSTRQDTQAPPGEHHDDPIHHPIIDVISIGSVTRMGLMEVQRRTWASATRYQSRPILRHFWAIHEDNVDPDDDDDDDTTCYNDLTVEDVMNISNWCRDRYMHNHTKRYLQVKYNSTAGSIRSSRHYKMTDTLQPSSWVMSQWIKHFGYNKWLAKKSNPVGWLCAQKRFAKGLAAVLKQYQRGGEYSIPDYVLLVDDDTYVNVDLLLQNELKDRNPMEPYVGAGCRVRIEMDASPITTFAFGGLGHVLSKASIERFTRPIHCSSEAKSEFESKVCSTISQDLIGEQRFFYDGMSVAELMDTRARAEAYLQFQQWQDGFCFHGDHYLAVMIHLYGILSTSVTEEDLTIMQAMKDSEIIIMSKNETIRKGNCWNEYDHCDPKTSVVCHYQTPQQMIALHEAKMRQQYTRNSSTTLSPAIHKMTECTKTAPQAYDVHFSDQPTEKQDNMIHRMNTSRRKCYEGVFVQLNDSWGAYVGGFTPNYSSACNIIQMFNIIEKRFVQKRELAIPEGFAQTHQAVTYDDESKFLYLLGGQLGGGCNVVSNKALRIHVVSKKTQILPNLPEGRYAAGSAVLRPAVNSTTAHVHIFGGASPLRNMTARQHWRLEISDDFGDGDTFVTAAAAGSPSTALTSWEELEPVPDSNSHGVTFEHEGYIYHGSALNNDFGMQPTENIDVCRANNQLGVDSHHTTSMGAIWRYASMRSSASPSRKGHWERIQDMPIPAGQALVVKVNDSFLVVGGSNTQREDGSTGTVIPNTWVRAFHPRRQEWDILSPLAKPTKFGGMAWFDSSTEKVYVVRHNNNRPKRPLFNEGTIFNVTIGTVRQAKSFQAKYLLDKEYRRIGVEGFQKCLAERVNDNGFKNVTLFDPAETYDQARKTWNLRQNHLQVPNVIAYPKNEEHVSAIIQCAKRNGFKVCGRNGKHSFEGHTCSFGVVVDTSYLNHIEFMDYAKGQVRLGAGLTLGKVAVEVEEGFNLVFPMGHCATVGVTGLMLVGGQGVLSRHFGMTIDYVSAIELVDESGLLIRATADNEFSDFLWLARGGGSGVQHFPGIITSIEFSGLPQPEKPASSAITTTSAGTGEKATKKAKVYTSFNIEFEPTVENAAQLLLAWQEFYRDDRHIEDPLFSRLTVEPWLRLKPNSLNGSNSNADGYERQLYLACYFYGNEEYHQQFMDVYYPKLVNLLPPSLWSSNESNGGYVTVSKVNRLSNVAFHKRLSGVRTKGQLASGQDGWDLDKRWKGYSAVARDSSVSEDAFRILAQSIYESQPFTERYVEMKPLGGAISSVPQDATSFGYREAKWWLLTSHFMLESDFHKSDNNVLHTIDHVRKERHSRATMILNNSRNQHNHFLDAMQDSFGGFYAGYIDQGSSTGRDLELYYSQSHAKKIADIKLRRDPHNLFHLYLPNAMDESSNYRHNL